VIRKFFDKIEGNFLLSFIRVLLELSWSLKISAKQLKIDYLLSSRNEEHFREEGFPFGMSKESLTTFLQELFKEERMEMAKYPQSHKDYMYACKSINTWIDSFLEKYRGKKIPCRAVYILLYYIRLRIEYWWILSGNQNEKKDTF
jgi:hypothetical protein